MSGDNRKRAIRAIMAETGMKYMAAMRELERREAAAAEQAAEEPAARSEPIGWNIYSPASERDITMPAQFIEFIPNEEALAPAAESFADDIEEWAARGE